MDGVGICSAEVVHSIHEIRQLRSFHQYRHDRPWMRRRRATQPVLRVQDRSSTLCQVDPDLQLPDPLEFPHKMLVSAVKITTRHQRLKLPQDRLRPGISSMEDPVLVCVKHFAEFVI